MSAYEGVNSYFNGELYQKAKEFGYDDANLCILEGDIPRLKREHIRIYTNLFSCAYHRDKRTPLEYGQDLVASWFFEDYLLSQLQNATFAISLAGADKSRVILPNQSTSTTSDYLILFPSGRETHMELVNDYTGFWAKHQTLHLRDQKYVTLKNQGSLLLAILLTPTLKSYTLYDFRKPVPSHYIPHHFAYGNKPVYELEIPRESMKAFSIPDIIHRIEEAE